MKKTVLPFAAMLLVLSSSVLAVSFERELSPKTIKQDHIDIEVKTKMTSDGLVTFTVSHTGEKPRYLVGHMVVKDANKTYLDSTTTLVTRDKLDVFYFSIPRDLVATSTFELSVGSLVESNGEAVPMPSMAINQIQLAEFVPSAVKE